LYDLGICFKEKVGKNVSRYVFGSSGKVSRYIFFQSSEKVFHYKFSESSEKVFHYF
jgi:hypothetical protein